MTILSNSELLHSRFLARAESEPSRPAVVGPGGELSYGQLGSRSAALAGRLHELGARPNQLVAVVLEKGWRQIVAVMGILRSGAAYLPIDPALPQRRIWDLLADGEVRLAVTDGRLREKLRWPQGVSPIRVGHCESAALVDPVQRDDDLAYVIYTSGSTGRPKGVMIDHRAAINTIADINRRFGIGRADRTLALSSLSFDLSVYDIFGVLAAGGTIVMPASGTRREPAHWAELMTRFGVTIWNSVPVLMRMLVEHLEARGHGFSKALRLVLLSGDWIPVGLPNRVKALAPSTRVIGLGGTTEGSIWSTLFPIDETDLAWKRIPYGRPLALQDVSVRDRVLRRCPVGVWGELCIGGRGVARGYWGDPRRTAERFVCDPEDGGRLYRTGDLGFMRSDGNVELIGRLDQQVKIQGHRVELGEIEAVLERHPMVRACAVLAPDTPAGERQLKAFVVLTDECVTSEGLSDFLAARLPGYMIPNRIQTLDQLPLNANGKPDRRALAAISTPPRSKEAEGETRSSTERLLLEIWSEVLGRESIGPRSDFFLLGGTSLQATQVVSRLWRRLGIDLPVGSLFEHPTVAGLAPLVERREGPPSNLPTPISQEARSGDPPLSFSQERVWFLQSFAETGGAYHFQAALRLRGRLDLPALQDSLNEIARRHEILRTSFPTVDNRPVQRVHPPERLELRTVDLTSTSRSGRSASERDIVDSELRRPFDPTRLPLVRWLLLRVSSDEHVLLHVEHHLLHDGWSFTLFLRELAELYGAFTLGEPSPLPELPIQFADFAIRQRGWMRGRSAAAQLDYWKQKLAGPPPVLQLPLDRPRPPVQTFRGNTIRVTLPAASAAALEKVATSARTTPFMRMLAVFYALLYRYTEQSDLSVGSGIANRRWPETEAMLGMFLNNVVLRSDLSGDPTFLELLERVRQVVLDAFAHQDIPFDRVVKAVRPQRDASRNPLFQVMFSFHDSPLLPIELPGLQVRVQEALSNGSAKFDLNVIAIPITKERTQDEAKVGGMILLWEYNSDLLDEVTVRRMSEHFLRLLESAVKRPDAPLSRLEMMTEGDRRRLLTDWNQTRRSYPKEACIHELFQKQASERAKSVALVAGDEILTYTELNRRANRLAHYLGRRGVGPETGIALDLERSGDQMIALIAILKSGGYYVPVDPKLPLRRREAVLRDSGASVMVTARRRSAGLPESDLRWVILDDEVEAIAQERDDDPVPATAADNLAYVLHTSGSTGVAKGVGVTHRNVIRLVRGVDYADLSPDETFLQLAPLSFDASTFEIWGCLLNGGRLVLGPTDLPSLDELADMLLRHEVTTLWLTAGLFHQMVDCNVDALGGLKQLLAGGDVLQRSAVRRAHRSLGSSSLVNGYGPTETTTFACCLSVADPDRYARSVPIGRPIGNTRVHVLTADLRLAPIGVPGEIFIGGDGVSRGYVNRPGLTAERFLPDPFGTRPGDRLYRTGDRARYLSDGDIEFLGRLDRQLKVRGFRVEPVEIEVALLEHPAIAGAAVALDSRTTGRSRLTAFIALADTTQAPTSGELRDHLRSIVPSYMMPSDFVVLDALPLMPNGKLDRSALKQPRRERSRTEGAAPDIGTAVEIIVARIWERVLDLPEVGITDDFFELGGDSLVATRMVSRLRDELGVKLPMARVFETPTVRGLAEAVVEIEPQAEATAIRGNQAAAAQARGMAAINDEVDRR